MTDLPTINVDDCTDIEETYGNARIEWDNGKPVIEWSEHMKFHSERLNNGETFGDAKTLPERVQRELQRLLGNDYACAVDWSDADETDGYDFLELSVWLSLDLDPAMTQEAAFDLLWPAIATLFNVTDPGTFNCEYLFSSLAV